MLLTAASFAAGATVGGIVIAVNRFLNAGDWGAQLVQVGRFAAEQVTSLAGSGADLPTIIQGAIHSFNGALVLGSLSRLAEIGSSMAAVIRAPEYGQAAWLSGGSLIASLTLTGIAAGGNRSAALDLPIL